MQNKDTELVFILDKSGSMSGLEKDTIGGFNALLEKQKGQEGLARVSTVLFDHRYTLLHDRLPIEGVAHLTKDEYEPEGTTALLDAVGRTIDSLLDKLKERKNEERPSVLFVIITDGEENASRDYSLERVREKLEFCQKSEGWEFLYLGANVDAFRAASNIGISKTRTARYHADAEGVRVNFEALDRTILSMRSSNAMDGSWKDEIEKDFTRREKRKS